MPHKFTKVVTQATFGASKKTELFMDGVLVATETIGRDLYCRIGKGGSPSNLREVSKKCVRVSWNYEAIRAALPGVRFNFTVVGPDLKWGFTGEGLTMKDLKTRVALAEASVTPSV